MNETAQTAETVRYVIQFKSVSSNSNWTDGDYYLSIAAATPVVNELSKGIPNNVRLIRRVIIETPV